MSDTSTPELAPSSPPLKRQDYYDALKGVTAAQLARMPRMISFPRTKAPAPRSVPKVPPHAR